MPPRLQPLARLLAAGLLTANAASVAGDPADGPRSPEPRDPVPHPSPHPEPHPEPHPIPPEADHRTALDRYVARPDEAFAYELVASAEEGGVTTYLLRLTSQRWRREGEVSHPLWTHWLRISVPPRRRSGLAVLHIRGGSRPADEPPQASDAAAVAAAQTGLVVASVTNIPNQPLAIAPDLGDGRYEDDLIAESWLRALETGDMTWAVQLPMVKATVAAMDAVERFLAELDEPVDVSGFGLAGASKRGWTAWLTAAADGRVRAIAPMVIPLLNMGPNFRHHFSAYGFFAPPLRDYSGRGLVQRLGTPEADRLAALVDPFAYRDRLTMPKYVMSAAGDEFFVTDSDRWYFDALPGENRLWVAARAGHNITARPEAIPALLSFFARVAEDPSAESIPGLDWRREGDVLAVRPLGPTPPSAVYVYRAENADARDFRTVAIGDRPGSGWTARVLQPDEDGAYRAELAAPPEGWAAYVVEAVFPPTDGAAPLVTSTPAVIVPDDLPFADVPLEGGER